MRRKLDPGEGYELVPEGAPFQKGDQFAYHSAQTHHVYWSDFPAVSIECKAKTSTSGIRAYRRKIHQEPKDKFDDMVEQAKKTMDIIIEDRKDLTSPPGPGGLFVHRGKVYRVLHEMDRPKWGISNSSVPAYCLNTGKVNSFPHLEPVKLVEQIEPAKFKVIYPEP